jgi:LysM domain
LVDTYRLAPDRFGLEKSNRARGCFVPIDEDRYLRNQLGTSSKFCELFAVVLVVSVSSGTAGKLAPCDRGQLAGREFTCDIHPGDTLNGMASRYGLALSVLTSANHLKPDSILRPGEILDNRHVVQQTLTYRIFIHIPQRRIFLEVDSDAFHQTRDPLSVLCAAARTADLTAEIDWRRADGIIARATGVPRQIGQSKLILVSTG